MEEPSGRGNQFIPAELKNQISRTSFWLLPNLCRYGRDHRLDDCGREIVEPCGCNKTKSHAPEQGGFMNKRGPGRPRKAGRPKGSKKSNACERFCSNNRVVGWKWQTLLLLTSDDTVQKLYETTLAIVAYKDTPIYRGHMSDFRGTGYESFHTAF